MSGFIGQLFGNNVNKKSYYNCFIISVFEKKEASTSKEVVQPEAVQPIEYSDEGVTFKAQSYESKEDPTLLHWILAQGNKASLQDILDYCQKGLALVNIKYLL